MAKRPPVYPFTAIVGQDRMKTALILNAIDMRIGGVLIRGERGTGKSTIHLSMMIPPVPIHGRMRYVNAANAAKTCA
jgi:Mg-chelatase subunit ChlI